MAELNHVRAKKHWRDFSSQIDRGRIFDFNIGLAASFTTTSLVPMLGTALLDQQLTSTIQLSEYNHVIQTCFDYRSQFPSEPNVLILLWRIEELLHKEFNQFISGENDSTPLITKRIDELIDALRYLRDAFKGTLIVSIPPFPSATPVGLEDINIALNAGYFHRTVVKYFFDQSKDLEQIRFIDLDALQRQFGARASSDLRKWYLYKQPYSETFLWELGVSLARTIYTNKIPPKKCVILDCDNTLWGGIIGEDGIENIHLGKEAFPGSAFYDLQQYFLYLRNQGILLAIVSKNNEADIWQVFDQHDGMALKREHLSAWRINWEPKSTNIKAIAAELNIGTDSLVFIDDSHFEIDEVQSKLPEVVSVRLNDEPAYMVDSIKNLHLFDKLELTIEDINRAAMLNTERQRAALRQQLTEKDFISSLGLQAEINRANASQLSRVTQLINKTNQFNLTSIRRTIEEVKKISSSADWQLYTMQVSDKYGDYGLVGVAIMEKNQACWRLDTFLLSCRVLGRRVETAFLASLAKEARQAGIKTIEASFIPTLKNAPVATFLPNHGFVPSEDNRFMIPVENIPAAPAYIAINHYGKVAIDE